MIPKVLGLILFILLDGLFILLFVDLFIWLIQKKEYEKLLETDRTQYDFKSYLSLREAIEKRLKIEKFEIVYFKEDLVVIKINYSYYSFDENTNSLIYLFNDYTNLIINLENKKKCR